MQTASWPLNKMEMKGSLRNEPKPVGHAKAATVCESNTNNAARPRMLSRYSSRLDSTYIWAVPDTAQVSGARRSFSRNAKGRQAKNHLYARLGSWRPRPMIWRPAGEPGFSASRRTAKCGGGRANPNDRLPKPRRGADGPPSARQSRSSAPAIPKHQAPRTRRPRGQERQ